jgi:isopenicillin N synthase-like dioxygenase
MVFSIREKEGLEMSGSAIPEIDISAFPGGSAAAKEKASSAVAEALARIGFMTIVGHGISEQLVAEIFRVSREFFDLPTAEKMKARHPEEKNHSNRGYIPLGAEYFDHAAKGKTAPDNKEGFVIGRLDLPPALLYKPHAGFAFASNVWLEHPAEFRPTLEAYYRAMEGLAFRMLEVFAHALSLPTTFFMPFFNEHTCVLRTQHYPHQDRDPEPGQLRGGAHTDYGAMAIVAADGAPGGLQLKSRGGVWIDVRPKPGAFVVNIGDLMMTWTNDRWLSNLHRVVNPPRTPKFNNRRQSMTFFVNANYDALIECIPTCLDAGETTRHEPILAGEHRAQKLRDIAAA